jgi:PTS system nitrogen regulatory IIA component
MDLTVRDAARLLHVSDKTVYRWIRDGALPAHRLHDQYRLNRVDLLEWANAQKLNVSPDLFQNDEEPRNGCTLVQCVQNGGVVYDIPGPDKSTVLRAIVHHLPLPAGMDRDYFYQLFMAREALSSTGVGNGIALPHARNPVVLHLARPAIMVSFLKQPVDFGALDGKPVFVLFTLLSPTTRAHLQVLSRLSFALRDQSFLNVLERKAPRGELLDCLAAIEKTLNATAAHATGLDPGQ